MGLYSNGKNEDEGYLGGLEFNTSNTFYGIIPHDYWDDNVLNHCSGKLLDFAFEPFFADSTFNSSQLRFTLFLMGLYCVVYSHNHNDPPTANLYSMHSGGYCRCRHLCYNTFGFFVLLERNSI